MALATLRLNIDDVTGPGKVGEILIRPVSSANNTAAWTSTKAARIPLKYADAAHASTDPGYAPTYTSLDGTKYPQVTQGAYYEFTVVRVNNTIDGTTFTAQIPATSSVDFDDLSPTVPIPAPGTYAYTTAATDALLATKVDATPTGRERLAIQDYAKLQPLFAAIEKRNTAAVPIGFMGPSTVEGYLTAWASTPTQVMQRRLRQRFPTTGLAPTQGGTGIIPIPSGPVRGVGATASPTTTPWTFSASMQFDETVFASGVTHTIAYTNGTEYGSITTDRDLTHWSVNHVKGTAGGAAAAYVQANALTPFTFSTSNASTIQADTVITAAQLGFSSGVIPSGTVIKTGGMGTGAYFILGHVEGFYNDQTKGIRVHNIGHSGYDTTDWLQTVAGGTTLASITGLGLKHLLLDFFGINAGSTGRPFANGGSRTAAQWKTEMVTFIAALRTAGVTCNITLIASYDATGGIALMSSWQSYVTAMREIATADSTVSFYDHSVRMAGTSAGNVDGYYAADLVHLTAAGNTKVVDGILDYILKTMDGGIVGESLQSKADLVNGKVPASQLGTGSTGVGSYYLADDGSYQPIGKKLDVVPWRSALWYESQFCGFNLATTATVAGTIYYVPITIPQSGAIDQIGINVTTVATGSSLQFGIYADSTGIPGALIRDYGNVASAVGTGAKTITGLAHSVTPGLYWLALLPLGGTPTVQFHAAPTAVPQYAGSAAVGDVQRVGYNQTGAASLPATASTLVTSTSITRPRVQIKWT